MEKSVRVVVVGVEEKGKAEGEGSADGGKPDADGGWKKDGPSATATAVGLGATPVVLLLLPLVDADIAFLWCCAGKGSECVALAPLPPGTNPPP